MKFIFKKPLVWLWNKLIDILILIYKKTIISYDWIYQKFSIKPNIMTLDETIQKIIDEKVSIARYGDGEFKLTQGKDISFQDGNEEIKERLKTILKVNDSKFLICLPDIFESLNAYTDEPRNYWRLHVATFRSKWNKLINFSTIYGNAFVSRCYYQYKDKSKCELYFKSLQKIWENREIIIVEGKKSRLGIGNDLFDNTSKVNRILVPEVNAFDSYTQILSNVLKQDKEKLILLAIGPTATVLAYDLYLAGYQVLDIGHIDVEYEWFLRKAERKIPLENKFVCEAGFGEGVGELDNEEYKNQIIDIL